MDNDTIITTNTTTPCSTTCTCGPSCTCGPDCTCGSSCACGPAGTGEIDDAAVLAAIDDAGFALR